MQDRWTNHHSPKRCICFTERVAVGQWGLKIPQQNSTIGLMSRKNWNGTLEYKHGTNYNKSLKSAHI